MLIAKNQRDDHTNLDPLMDILTAAVGIMLVIVLFAILAARGHMITTQVTVRVLAPRLRQPPPGATAKLFLCQGGRLYAFALDQAVEKLLAGFDPKDLPGALAKAQTRTLHDVHFHYTLTSVPGNLSMLLVLVEVIAGAGETAQDLHNSQTTFATIVSQLDQRKHWVHFLVDPESFDVFKVAKDLVQNQAFSIGWDPVKISFPHQECVMGCPDDRTAQLPIIRGINILGR
jgi:hypothetical protein